MPAAGRQVAKITAGVCVGVRDRGGNARMPRHVRRFAKQDGMDAETDGVAIAVRPHVVLVIVRVVTRSKRLWTDFSWRFC